MNKETDRSLSHSSGYILSSFKNMSMFVLLFTHIIVYKKVKIWNANHISLLSVKMVLR